MKLPTSKILLFIAVLSHHSYSFAQMTNNWSDQEKSYYRTIKGLCNYIQETPDSLIKVETLTDRWIYFDYVLNDTSSSRKQRRIKKLETLLQSFKHYIDSIGLSNLDTKPLRYYKSSKKVMGKFSRKPDIHEDQIFAYYDRKNSLKPLGYLFFDDRTSKLISWILLKQGSQYYFLTFNML